MSSFLFESNSEIIISASSDGFTSRMEMLFVLPFALENFPQKQIRLFWPRNACCNANYEDIFNVPKILKPINEFINYYSDSNPSDSNVKKFLELQKKIKGSKIIAKEGEFSLYHRQYVFHTLMNHDQLKRKRFLKSLTFSKQVLDLFNSFVKYYKINQDVIGIHIRSLETPKWHLNIPKDELSGRARLNKLISYYKKQIQHHINLNKNQKFLIRSDDHDIVKVFYKQFPNNVINAKDEYPEHIPDESIDDYRSRIINREKDSVLSAIAHSLLPLSITNYNDKIKLDMKYGSFTFFPLLMSSGKLLPVNDPIFKTLYKLENS